MEHLSKDHLLFRQAFPALRENIIEGKPYIYLDSAATALKPDVLISSTIDYYSSMSGSVHRSRHSKAIELTEQYESAREKVAKLIGTNRESIIWTKGTTESINLITHSFAKHLIKQDDEIIIPVSEHHANIIPWIMLAESTGAKIVPLPINNQLTPDTDELARLVNSKTRMIALSQLSNITGAKSDIRTAVSIARQFEHCYVVLDGAQGIVHDDINVTELDIDFYCFSAHKLYGPTGVGILYAKPENLSLMQPWQGGGKMISHAKIDKFIAEEPPYCFEAGTPNIAGIIGFSVLLDWLKEWDRKALEAYSSSLATFANDELKHIAGYKRISVENSSLLTFTINGVNVNDLEILLAEQQIATRSGLHCAHPLNKALGISGSIRASFAPYNTIEETEIFCSAVKKAVDILK